MTTEITEYDLYGSPFDQIFYMILILSSPFLLLYGIRYYPLMNDNHANYWKLPLAIFVVSFIIMAIFNNKIFPCGDKLPWIKWAATVAMSAVAAMLILGIVLVLNAKLDRNRIIKYKIEIVGKRKSVEDYSLKFVLPGDISSNFKVTEQEYLRATVDSKAVLKVRSGYFGLPWIQDYDIEAN